MAIVLALLRRVLPTQQVQQDAVAQPAHMQVYVRDGLWTNSVILVGEGGRKVAPTSLCILSLVETLVLVSEGCVQI